MTTEPAPDDRPLADRHAGQDGRARADRGALLDEGRDDLPVGLGLEAPAFDGRPGVHIVDKGDVMADEDVVLDGHALADEGVRGDLAVLADKGVLLDLDERPDLGAVADRAAVEVDEGEDLDVFPQLDVGAILCRIPWVLLYSSTLLPPFLMDSSAASRRRTTWSPAWPLLKGSLVLSDALDEILGLGLEGLGRLELGDVDVARAVAHEQIVDAVPAVGALEVDAAVVDLDLLVGVEVVPDEHLLVAADQGLADLDRAEPVDVEMGDESVALELDGDIGDVFESALEVDGAVGRDGHRLLVDDMVHDRKVVGGQVPDDVDVVLEEPQVDPDRIVEEELAQLARIDEFLDLLHGAREKERVVDHDLELLLGGEVDELPGLGAGRGERFLDEDVLPGQERRLGQLIMGEDGRDDGHGVHVRGPDELQGVLDALDEGIVGLGQAEALLREVADRDQLGAGRAMEIPGHVGPPIAVSDDTDVIMHGTLRTPVLAYFVELLDRPR